jgi:ABC-type uncharacterized transport system ATPase subunit
MGIMLISSELPEVLALAHRIVVMHEGRVTGILEREALAKKCDGLCHRHGATILPPQETEAVSA